MRTGEKQKDDYLPRKTLAMFGEKSDHCLERSLSAFLGISSVESHSNKESLRRIHGEDSRNMRKPEGIAKLSKCAKQGATCRSPLAARLIINAMGCRLSLNR